MDTIFSTDHIAILLACKDGEAFIGEQIKSIILQTEDQWELFIHDDGSTDQTVSICKQYAQEYPNKIHVIGGAKTGSASANFFFLLSSVRAPYYMFCDQDDYWKKDKIAHTLCRMKEADEPDTPVLVFSDLEVVDEQLKAIDASMNHRQGLNPERTAFAELMIQNCITGCTVMINETLAELMRKPCDTGNVIMHDWWAGLIASYFGKVLYLPEATILYRQHGENSLGSYKATSISFIKSKLLQKDEIHNSLQATQTQVGEFIKTFEVQDEMLETYSQLYQFPKGKRRAFYRDHKIHMQGNLRNLGLFFFG